VPVDVSRARIKSYVRGAALSMPWRRHPVICSSFRLSGALAACSYSGSKLLATIAGAAVTYHHPDHLSNRVETDASATMTRTFGHLPFGEVWYETGTGDKWKFTSYERDTAESGLDYAMFRYYGSGYARFTSPDRLAGNKGNPQSLNRYAYVLNDPLNAVDPLGLLTTPGTPPNPTPIGGAGGAPGDPWENHFLCALFGVMCEDTGIPLFFQGGGHGGGGGDAARKAAIDRIKDKCLQWILDTLRKAWDERNAETHANGQGILAETYAAQNVTISEKAFVGALNAATILPPNNDSRYSAEVVGNTTIQLGGGWAASPDKPLARM
jgi:RHS repeat-associated protein